MDDNIGLKSWVLFAPNLDISDKEEGTIISSPYGLFSKGFTH